jgi:hypothetical protein
MASSSELQVLVPYASLGWALPCITPKIGQLSCSLHLHLCSNMLTHVPACPHRSLSA